VLEVETLSDSLADALIDTDVRSWMHYREEVWELAQRFRARGGRTAMLSNGVPEIISRIRADRPLDQWFDVVVVSCEVGCVKPDRAIYELCLNAVSATPAAALFVDDRLDNIQAADAIGMRTLHFTDDEGVGLLRQALEL
jgi:putative hydrolase of the HAD superfamily